MMIKKKIPIRLSAHNRGLPRRLKALLALTALLAVLSIASAAVAHHILGIPHYAYDEMYPQAPVLTYRVLAGIHEVKMTGYPGKPAPGERCALHVYIKRTDNNQPFDGEVTLVVMKDRLMGEDPVIYGPVAAEQEGALFKFYPQFDTEDNYLVRIQFYAEGVPWIIDLPMVAGEPGSPLVVLGCVLAGLAMFLIVIRAIRIKLRRRQAADASSAAVELSPKV